jgi:hypothetical protein
MKNKRRFCRKSGFRQIMNDVVAVPVGQTAREFNGMILLNEVSKVLWETLSLGTTLEKLTDAITEQFAVSREEATADILEFLDRLRNAQLLEEV